MQVAQAQQDTDNPVDNANATDRGVVLEFDDSADYETQATDRQRSVNDESEEVDFIIGGEGDGGIAKRGILKVID